MLDPTKPFSLFDIPAFALIVLAMSVPRWFYYRVCKGPTGRAAKWIPRVRPLGIAALVLLVGDVF